jgi:hypothetical protein
MSVPLDRRGANSRPRCFDRLLVIALSLHHPGTLVRHPDTLLRHPGCAGMTVDSAQKRAPRRVKYIYRHTTHPPQS